MTGNQATKKFRRERRGVGAIIGGVILIGILLTTMLVYYVAILNNDQRKAMYDIQSASASDDRTAESLKAIDRGLHYVDETDNWYLRVDIKNEGSVPLVVSYSALQCLDAECAQPYDPRDANITLNPGQEHYGMLLGPGIEDDRNYRVDLITERGRIFPVITCVTDFDEFTCIDIGGGGAPRFLLFAAPNSLMVQQGTDGETIISVNSINGFTSPVELGISADPAIFTTTLSDPIVTPPADGSASSTLTIGVNSGVTDGTYPVTVTGTSGSNTQQIGISITVIHIPTEDEILLDDALIKPQIQGVFPNPYGATASNSARVGLWGVVVANPSDAPMTVSRVVITAFLPYGNNPTVFPNNVSPGGCAVDITQVPSVGGSWSCPARNVLAWSGSYTIPERSAQEFFVKVGRPSSNENFPSYGINFNVFTTFGQYAKAGYSGSMTSSPSEIANVYLSTSTGNMVGTLTGTSGGQVQARATIANFGDTGVINSGSKLIVSIPRAFTNVNLASNPPTGFNTCTVTTFSDNSAQISCPISSNLTSGQTRSIEFTMDAPTVTETRLYPLLVLADGTDGNSAPMGAVGAVSENVVVVTP